MYFIQKLLQIIQRGLEKYSSASVFKSPAKPLRQKFTT